MVAVGAVAAETAWVVRALPFPAPEVDPLPLEVEPVPLVAPPVAVGVVLWMQRLEAGTMLNAQAAALQSVRIDRLEDRTESQFREIKESLARIEQKLDRKADRR